jgi:MFS family permease
LVKQVSEGLPKAAVDQRTSVLALVSHVGTLAGVILVPWLCERWGRKRTIFGCFLLAPAAVALAIGGTTSFERLLWFSPVMNMVAIGVSAAFVLYFPELFPQRVRATGMGLAYNAGRLLGIPMPMITGAITGQYGGSIAAGVLLSGMVYVVGLLAIPFAPETLGKPLPEDEAPLDSG